MASLIQLHPQDQVAIALTALDKGSQVTCGSHRIRTEDMIHTGHKVALVPIRQGEKVRRNNVPIGSATRDIQPGEHVHLHNLKSDYIPTINQHYTDNDSLADDESHPPRQEPT